MEAVKPYIAAVFYLASVAILVPNFFLLELVKLIANIIASVPHECGHFIFNIFALLGGFIGINFVSSQEYMFLSVLAGSLGYTLTPIILAVFYFLKKDGLTGGAYTGFLAVSLDHMAWYCADALNQSGPLFNGPISIHHDWYFMLTYLGAMNQASTLSSFFQITAYFTAAAALLFCVVSAASKLRC